MKFLNIMASWLRHCMAASAVILLLLPALAVAEAGRAVGEVSLVLGSASLESAAGNSNRLARGTPVHVNDRVITGANGHVHIQFEDGAMVSVRPDSRLQVERYEYNPQAPERSSVRFSLEEGITRSISGDAARSARERFRLNTPIAAIGVRGTDFVVAATNTTTQAMVYEGVIALAPFSPECSMDSFGPCLANAVELGDNAMQMLVLDESAPLPRLVPSPNVAEPNMMRAEVEQAIAANAANNEARFAATADEADGDSAGRLELVQEAVTTPQVSSDVDEAAAAVKPKLPTEFTPDSALSFAQLNSRNLIWGRFSKLGSGEVPAELERITVPFSQASANRQPAVTNLDYILFRRDINNQGLPLARMEPRVLSFRLNSAQAFYNSGSGVTPMDVTGGKLDIDLGERRFATELNLDSAATGAVDFTATGGVFDGGFFHSRSADQRIAGAIGVDGREAGYFFERQLEQGEIQGLTLWDSR